jgi:hypothetical protein
LLHPVAGGVDNDVLRLNCSSYALYTRLSMPS